MIVDLAYTVLQDWKLPQILFRQLSDLKQSSLGCYLASSG